MKYTDFFANFFVVEDPGSRKFYRGQILPEPEKNTGLLRAEYRIDHLEIHHLEGSGEPGNLFWNMVNDPFCINQSVADAFSQDNIQGWTATPASVLTKSGDKSAENYFAVSVTGRSDAVDYLQTDIVFRQLPGGNYPYFKGIYFDPESWDGSDIFMERPDQHGHSNAFIYVTKKLVDICKKRKVKNIAFTNFNDYLTDCDMIKIGASDILQQKIDEMIKNYS